MTRVVREIMSQGVKTLRSDQPLLDAMVFMREEQIRHLPVVDGEGHLVGLVTDRDIKRATPSVLLRDQRAQFESTIRDTPLAKVMARNVISVGPETPLREAIQLMLDEKVGCLPVLEEGKLAGIVTATDLLEALRGLVD